MQEQKHQKRFKNQQSFTAPQMQRNRISIWTKLTFAALSIIVFLLASSFILSLVFSGYLGVLAGGPCTRPQICTPSQVPDLISSFSKLLASTPWLTLMLSSVILYLLITVWRLGSSLKREKRKTIASSLPIPNIVIERGNSSTPSQVQREIIDDSISIRSILEPAREYQINLIQAWLKDDPALRNELQLVLDGDRNIRLVRPNNYREMQFQRLQERLLFLEKNWQERVAENIANENKSWFDWLVKIDTIAGIIVAIPTILLLISSLVSLFPH